MIWTQHDITILTDIYSEVYTREVARILNRTCWSVYNMAAKLGLTKSEDFKAIKKRHEAEVLLKSSKKYCFPKGHTPHNKGKKMPESVKEKVKSTMFKNGNIPANTKYDGYESVDIEGYTWVRVSQGKRRLKHRMIYEQHHGPISKTQIVKFIDGDKTNFDINNLKLISRRENMENNTIHNYPPEIKASIFLISKIKKHIHNATQQN